MNINTAEIIPTKAIRKLDALFLQDETLQQNQEMKDKILLWAKELLLDVRKEWNDLHSSTISEIILQDRKMTATESAKKRDKRYAPFREYFKKVQEKKFKECYKEGRIMTANGFALWFLNNKAKDVEIPYCSSNLKNKLIRLAESNNREFKNTFAS